MISKYISFLNDKLNAQVTFLNRDEKYNYFKTEDMEIRVSHEIIQDRYKADIKGTDESSFGFYCSVPVFKVC